MLLYCFVLLLTHVTRSLRKRQQVNQRINQSILYPLLFYVQGGPKRWIDFIIAIILYQINPGFCFPGEWWVIDRAQKSYSPVSMDQAARYSMQEMIQTVDAYFTIKSVIQTQPHIQRGFSSRNAQTRVTIQHLLNKFRREVYRVTLKDAVDSHGQSGQKSHCAWDHGWSSLQ